VSKNDEESRPAFEILSGGEGSIDAAHMRTLIPLVGEDLSDEAIDALFVQADKDKSGLIDFKEFVGMMVALSPKALKVHGTSLLDRAIELTAAQKEVDEYKFAVDEARVTNNEKKIEKTVAILSVGLLRLMIAEEVLLHTKPNPKPNPKPKPDDRQWFTSTKKGKSRLSPSM